MKGVDPLVSPPPLAALALGLVMDAMLKRMACWASAWVGVSACAWVKTTGSIAREVRAGNCGETN